MHARRARIGPVRCAALLFVTAGLAVACGDPPQDPVVEPDEPDVKPVDTDDPPDPSTTGTFGDGRWGSATWGP